MDGQAARNKLKIGDVVKSINSKNVGFLSFYVKKKREILRSFHLFLSLLYINICLSSIYLYVSVCDRGYEEVMAFIHSSPRPIQFIFLRLLDGGNNNNNNNDNEMNNHLPSPPPSSQSTNSSSINNNNNNQLKKSQVEFIPGSSSKVRCVEMEKHIHVSTHISLSFLSSLKTLFNHLLFYIS